MRQPEKVGTASSSSDKGYHACDLGKSATLSAHLYTLSFQVFKHCDLLVLKMIILWEATRITLYSQNPNPTRVFKIRFWVFPHGLWRAGSSECRVIPPKSMKRGWKYPLKHQEGGDGTPWKVENWEPWAKHDVHPPPTPAGTHTHFLGSQSLPMSVWKKWNVQQV